jgi:hypothetical protein
VCRGEPMALSTLRRVMVVFRNHPTPTVTTYPQLEVIYCITLASAFMLHLAIRDLDPAALRVLLHEKRPASTG